MGVMASDDSGVGDRAGDENNVSTLASSQRGSLVELRARENERMAEDRRLRIRLMWSCAIIGAMVGMFAGYLGVVISIVNQGVGVFGWDFYRPDLINFLRTSFAYVVPGALVGGVSTYVLFNSRSEMKSPLRWVIIWILAALGIPLLSGFFLPVTLILFIDIWEGLRPGLWASALLEAFLASFLDGFIYMVTVLSGGAVSGLLFVAVSIGALMLWMNDPIPERWDRLIPRPAYHYLIAFVVSAVPLVIIMFGPFGLLRAFTGFLTGERL